MSIIVVNSTRSNKSFSLLHKIRGKEDQSELCIYMYTPYFNQVVAIKAVLVLLKNKQIGLLISVKL